MGGAHAVQLANTDRKTKALRNLPLDLAAGGRRVVLAVIQHTGEHLSSKLRGVAVSPLESARHLTLDVDGAYKLANVECPNGLESFQNLANEKALRYA